MCAISFGGDASKEPTKKLALQPELQGDIVPDFFALAPDNRTRLYREDLAKEAKKLGAKRVVLSFFATWCQYCPAELRRMKESSAKLKEKGVLVYLIDVGENLIEDGKKVGGFVEKSSGNAFPFYFDQNNNLLRSFGILEKDATYAVLPVNVVMDANLRVLAVFAEIGNDFPQVLWGNL
jgi:peroxiredoxin